MAKQVLVENLRGECEAMLERMQQAPLTEVLQACVQPVRDGFAGNFQTQAGSDGAKWPARKDKLPHPLLQESGSLLGATQGGAGKAEHVESRKLQVGVNKGVKLGGLPGAAVHNFGYPARNIPQREFVYASETTLDQCQAIIADGAYSVFFVF
jgi:hypothetical protein